MDDEALAELAGFHQVEPQPADEDDPLALVLRVVERLYDTDHLKALFEQLSPAGQSLLFWATEAPHPIPHRRFRDEARALAERTAERSGTVERLLLSIGFVHAVVTSDGEWLVVPDDMRMALDPVVDGWLSASNLATFETLRASSLPAFRDLFPRGFQGDPRFAARELMVAAVHLLERYDIQRVMIVDGDGHYGDGTDNIIELLGLRDQVPHITRDNFGKLRFAGASTAKWKSYFEDLLQDHKPGIIMYQAGADAWDQDPYGVGYLSVKGLMRRDSGMFEAAKDAGIPLVWNLAGGYADPMQKTIDIHLNTLSMSDWVYNATST